MIVYLNEKFIEEKLAHISIGDAGFLFGEGIFTTIRLYLGQAPEIERHWLRLQNQARALDITFTLTLDDIKLITRRLVQQNGLHTSDARMRITITRGCDTENPLPIIPSPDTRPTVLVTTSVLAASFDEVAQQGFAIAILGPEYLRAHSPGLKTLNYLPSLLALRQARTLGFSEAVILDENGFITEAATSNVFLVKKGALHTPADNGKILAGITRLRILEIARQNNMVCHEAVLSHEDLLKSDEVFLCNSIRQVIPVISMNGAVVGTGKPGPFTEKIAQWYRQAMQSD